MAVSGIVFGAIFLVVVGCGFALMAYLAWNGSKPSSFFTEAVNPTYELELSEPEINAYYDLKDQLQEKYAPEHAALVEEALSSGEVKTLVRWTSKVPPEERTGLHKALMRRLVSCIGKLDQVQRDKPGNWKMWQSKLISERYWTTLLEAERIVSQEIDSCVTEAEELEPGWREQIFHQGVQCYRMQRQHEAEKTEQKKAVVDEKKQAQRDEKRKEIEKRVEIERKLQQEREAQKMMEKLLREEEAAAASKKGKAATAKPKTTKKK